MTVLQYERLEDDILPEIKLWFLNWQHFSFVFVKYLLLLIINPH